MKCEGHFSLMVITLLSTSFILMLQNSSNRITLNIEYNVLIGCFSCISTQIILKSFLYILRLVVDVKIAGIIGLLECTLECSTIDFLV
jgi:hypothetical protein